ARGVDGRIVPSFVTNTGAYKQWVEYWRGEFSQKHKAAVSHSWLEDLKKANRGNFVLVDGGVILDAVQPNQLAYFTNELFCRLVEPKAAEEIVDLTLDRVADRIIKKLRLAKNPHFRTK